MAEIEVRLQRRFRDDDERSRVLVVRLNIGPDYGLDMLPYPTSLRSCVSRDMVADILAHTAARQAGRRLHLPGLRIAGQALPDLDVVVSGAPARLGVDGFLGLDFFEQFDVVEWRPKARRLRLIVD